MKFEVGQKVWIDIDETIADDFGIVPEMEGYDGTQVTIAKAMNLGGIPCYVIEEDSNGYLWDERYLFATKPSAEDDAPPVSLDDFLDGFKVR